ncbi:MAG: SDR family NAD(P)-dependent oxidoreductase [Dehalococcoidia bacterium]
MGKLDGKVALITGSGRNIGRATALKFAEEGADIVVNARSNQEEAEAVAQEVRALGRQALPVLADVSNKEQVDTMVKLALDQFGKVDILLNNAAIRPHKPFLELTLADWEQVRGIVLDGAFYCTHAVMPSMVENNFGRILFFTGDGAWGGSAERSHISANKMGLIGFSRSLATEFAPNNIRVNVISSGRIDTSRDTQWYPNQDMRQTSDIPLGRLGHVNDIATACLFLVSDDSAWITGQTLHVNGGSAFF